MEKRNLRDTISISHLEYIFRCFVKDLSKEINISGSDQVIMFSSLDAQNVLFDTFLPRLKKNKFKRLTKCILDLYEYKNKSNRIITLINDTAAKKIILKIHRRKGGKNEKLFERSYTIKTHLQ